MKRIRRLSSSRKGWLSSRFALVFGAVAFAFLLSGCGDKSAGDEPRQAGQTVTRDTQPWQAAATPFSATGKTAASDQASWGDAMKQRAQFQNEYVRIGAQ